MKKTIKRERGRFYQNLSVEERSEGGGREAEEGEIGRV